jgi:hypothetical protein
MIERYTYDLYYRGFGKRHPLYTPPVAVETEEAARARARESISFYQAKSFFGATSDSFDIEVKRVYKY